MWWFATSNRVNQLKLGRCSLVLEIRKIWFKFINVHTHLKIVITDIYMYIHKFCHFYHLKMYSTVVLSIWNGCLTITTIYLQNFFNFSNQNSVPIKNGSPFSPPPHPWQSPSYFPCKFLGTSYNWNHAILVILCLAYFT